MMNIQITKIFSSHSGFYHNLTCLGCMAFFTVLIYPSFTGIVLDNYTAWQHQATSRQSRLTSDHCGQRVRYFPSEAGGSKTIELNGE